MLLLLVAAALLSPSLCCKGRSIPYVGVLPGIPVYFQPCADTSVLARIPVYFQPCADASVLPRIPVYFPPRRLCHFLFLGAGCDRYRCITPYPGVLPTLRRCYCAAPYPGVLPTLRRCKCAAPHPGASPPSSPALFFLGAGSARGRCITP